MRLGALGVLVVWVGSNGISIAAESTITAARTALEQWVQTRKTIAQTRADWAADKSMLEQTVRLLERELDAIREQGSSLATNNVQAETERVQAEAQLKAAQEALEKARAFAGTMEVQLLKLTPRLPAPLQETLKPLLNKLPPDPAKTDLGASARILTVVQILGELDKFNNAVSIFSERRTNAKGEEVAVETVYIGLGAAYFVSEANDFAGVGQPGPNGWEWTAQPELADAVREVIRIYRNERPARFIALPATIR